MGSPRTESSYVWNSYAWNVRTSKAERKQAGSNAGWDHPILPRRQRTKADFQQQQQEQWNSSLPNPARNSGRSYFRFCPIGFIGPMNCTGFHYCSGEANIIITSLYFTLLRLKETIWTAIFRQVDSGALRFIPFLKRWLFKSKGWGWE